MRRAAREAVQSARALGFDAQAVRAPAADLKAAKGRAALLVRSGRYRAPKPEKDQPTLSETSASTARGW
jgi:hypothetical protein